MLQTPLEILLSGKVAWNRWRLDFPDVKAVEPDLNHVNLQGADLREMDLRTVDLTESNLQDADLRGVNLLEADLRQIDLRNANLSDADLQQCHLRGADARGANFVRANLRGADLTNADFRGADLQDANMRGAIIGNTKFDEIYLASKEFNKPEEIKKPQSEAINLPVEPAVEVAPPVLEKETMEKGLPAVAQKKIRKSKVVA